jgi:transcriptional regulator with XRE-family HTH domain
MTIGQRIRTARERRDMTLDEVARRCKTTKQTIFKYENEIVTNIPYDKIVLLSNALDVSPSYLFGWDEKENSPSEPQLTGVDKELWELLKLIPEEQKKLLLETGRMFVNNLRKD